MKEAHQLIEQVTLGKDPRKLIKEEDYIVDGVDLTEVGWDDIQGKLSDFVKQVEAFSGKLGRIHSVKSSHLDGLKGSAKQLVVHLKEAMKQCDRANDYADALYTDAVDQDVE
jgi:hypothetical protein